MTNRRDDMDDTVPENPQARLSSKKPDRPSATTHKARIALAHDWLVTVRGGEAVLERISAYVNAHHEAAGLFTLYDSGISVGPETDSIARICSSKSRLPMAGSMRRWMAPLYPSMVEELSGRLESLHESKPIDLLISTSSGLIKNLKPPGRASHLCYCHTPARWLYSQVSEYGTGSGGGLMRGLGLGLFGGKLRAFDKSNTRFVSRFVANSEHTRELIEEIYQREASVVPPPVDTDFYTPDPNTTREEFWLIVSALEPYKRIDLAIEAAAKARQRLIIAGEGTQRGFLSAHARSMCKRHAGGVKGLIELVGRVSNEQLRSLYRRAGAFLFPQVEDFGITAVEAQACGCPVVAYARGGALDSVIEGKTGSFFDEQSAEALIEAARAVPTNPGACRENALVYSREMFDQRMAMQIEAAI